MLASRICNECYQTYIFLRAQDILSVHKKRIDIHIPCDISLLHTFPTSVPVIFATVTEPVIMQDSHDYPVMNAGTCGKLLNFYIEQKISPIDLSDGNVAD